MNTTVRRWLPAALLPVVVVVAAAAVPAVADTTPNLPEKTAQQVLEMVSESVDESYSGTVEQSSDLGLPDLSALAAGATADASGGTTSAGSAVSTALELLTSSHTARVFIGGSDTARVQVMDTLAERDVIVNGTEVWFYDSDSNAATHLTLSSDVAAGNNTGAATGEAAKTPAELAEVLLAEIDPSTTVTVGDTARVAGRSVYTLTLTPKSADTLVASVTLSVDSETGLPLATAVNATAQDDAAFTVAFSTIDFTAPNSSLFDFTPPAGATVTEKSADDLSTDHGETDGNEVDGAADAVAEPTVSGEGWSSIVTIPAGTADTADTGDVTAMLEQLTTEVPEGRVLQTALVSVLIATDGSILIGAVPMEQLQTAAQLQAAAQTTP